MMEVADKSGGQKWTPKVAVLVLLSALVERFDVSRMRDFCRTQEGPGHVEAFQFLCVYPCVCVHPSVCSLNFILLC